MSSATGGGRIITFYSYKGGTGRSMALANVAWILASNGHRVLVIDWDLEAPGLHRYFHPFIEDKELTDSPGLIDYVVEFSEAARHAQRANDPGDTAWYERYTSLLRYTYSLDWDFGESTIDFVPAGQQGPGYALRVNGFNWQEFYDKLGGGILFEALKKRLREEYDYVLIDSRTGISDTSGICTIQMPDDLVVCFTLNEQSIKGAAAVAESADQQRRLATNEPSLRIWPVATRVELAEKDRLDAARDLARQTFQRYLGRLTRTDRAAYWSGIEILYQPYFAYEEVLAVFAERRRQKASMLSSLESLTQFLTNGEVSELKGMSEQDRLREYERFRRKAAVPSPSPSEGPRANALFLAFSYSDKEWVNPIADRLISRYGNALWYDQARLQPGDNWLDMIKGAQDSASVVVAMFGPGWLRTSGETPFQMQLVAALTKGTRLVPVTIGGLSVGEWVKAVTDYPGLARLAYVQATTISPDDAFDDDIARICDVLDRLLSVPSPTAAADPDDPQKGQWGGKSTADGRVLSAQVRPLSDDWFAVALSVSSTPGASGKPLEGEVEFHLHPTFPTPVVPVRVKDGRASLNLTAWGAFTIGVLADGGRTRLELDLAKDTSFPEVFRSR